MLFAATALNETVSLFYERRMGFQTFQPMEEILILREMEYPDCQNVFGLQ